ncbi:hypothetical protein EMIT0P265_10059 [Pseudomonas zeae]
MCRERDMDQWSFLARMYRKNGHSDQHFPPRLLVFTGARPSVYVPMTEYVAAPQADTLSHPLSCATDEHP